ncbi:histidine kinase [Porphyromonadaceae bacterium OttesenSCG-928-L07]|nr:histidine kinase [Porphyromonadaceae bacterium OttesenSCG-928-L07]MDL2252018.1 histidine kinase [Odoribacter sp. OttesenSCG-928-J03]MDL2282993.1 histidine kinase [Odoribacter sp. OttesenSCG-928-G04]MDL2331113.1 histidine kinase [Odoribacter sp. OttesenSCG-928-A06]
MTPQEKKQYLLENLIYGIIWLIIFIAPTFKSTESSSMDWSYILQEWRQIVPFFILFLINNYVLLPFFLIRKRSWLYVLLALAVVVLLFVIPPMSSGTGRRGPFPAHEPGRRVERPMDAPTPDREHVRPPLPSGPRPFWHMPGKMGPMADKWIIAILLLGFNIAIKLLFKSIRDDRQLKELEKHTLETELNYLKTQINPHFFMNTLNNIHALIDMDGEKAKDTLIGLSKMMRYVLYDASNQYVALSKEIEFLENYIHLMQIRYTDKLTVRFITPEIVPEIKLPPLLFISFIENAFKHGVSYKNDSYIYASLNIERDQLRFSVLNSDHSSDKTRDGVGLNNVQQRLKLLYGADYSLIFGKEEADYKVELIIPIKT